MNISSIASLLLAVFVFVFGVYSATDDFMAFVDWHAALIVFGGTMAVAAISLQMDRIILMMKIFYLRVIRTYKVEYVDVMKELLLVAEKRRKGESYENIYPSIKDHFVKEGVMLLAEGYMDPEKLHEVLSVRAMTIYNRYSEDARRFKALGKFPPAMGLMGAVLGMIALLKEIGKPGAEKTIGPAMAVALVATLYGIAFANLIILPIADHLEDGAKELWIKNRLVAEGLKLIAENKNRVIMVEELNSYLLPAERVDWKSINSSSQKAA